MSIRTLARFSALLFSLPLVILASCAGGGSGGGTTPVNNNNTPECVSDADCAGDQICSDGGFCVAGRCTRDSDCDDGEMCLENSGFCVVPECATNTDCDDGEYCDSEASKCLSGCLTDSDCGENETCNTNTKACESSAECASDADCGDLDLCRAEKCVTVQCKRDEHCTVAGELCNTDTNTCEPQEGFCDEDGDCDAGLKCDLTQNVCVEAGCGECPEGTQCNEGAGECWACARDSDCGQGGECNLTTHVCEDTRCRVDGDCGADEICNRITGECEAPTLCQDDVFEPNDTADSAGVTGPGAFTGLTICDGDEDWYSLNLEAGSTLTVDIAFTHADGNLDLELYDPNGHLIGAGTSNADNESIVAGDLALAGPYTVRVFPFDGATNTYGLELTVEHNNPTTCQDDGFEANNSADTASAIIAQDYSNLMVCAGDPDWYKVRLSPGEDLVATVTFVNAEGDLDLVVYDTDATTILGESRTTTDTEEASSGPVTATGDYYVVVAGSTAAIANGYALSLTKSDVPSTCTDDGFEANDVVGEARAVEPGLVDNLMLCPGNEDWFAVALNAGDDISAEIDFTDADGDLDLALYNPSDTATPIAQSRTDTDGEVVGITDVPESGLYLVRIFGATDTDTNAYILLLERTRPPSECVDDGFEDNDNSAAAVDPQAMDFAGQICSGDEDWFAFNVNAGGDILFAVDFTNSTGDLDLEIFGPDGTSLGTSASHTDDSELVGVLEAAVSGTYRVKVSGYLGAENSYTASVDITEPTTCTDDALEDNDDLSSAAAPGYGVHAGLKICSGDDDWYAVELSAGEGLTVDLTFTHADGDVDLFIKDATGTTLASSLTVSDNESATLTAVDAAGTYYVQVLGWHSASNSYDMTMTLIPSVSACEDDVMEQNDSVSAASPVTENIYTNLVLCEQDPDYYAIDLAEGETLDLLVEYLVSLGNIDVQILNPSGAVVGSSETLTDNETITYQAPTAGTYTILVYSTDPAVTNLYDMTLTVADASQCIDDIAEENDSADTAYAFDGPLIALGLGLCQDSGTREEDWFSIDVLPGETLEVSVFFDAAVADLDVEIVLDGVVLDGSYSISDSLEVATVIDAAGGSYDIRVYTWNSDLDINSNYDMIVDVY